MTSYSIEAAAAEICGEAGDSVKDPVRFVRELINKGQIRAYRVGHTWRMRREDIDQAIETLYNTKGLGKVYTAPTNLTQASLKRRTAQHDSLHNPKRKVN